jgi:hypothetical protein
LTFTSDDDYARAIQGDTWELPNIRAELEEGRTEIRVRIVEHSQELVVQANFSPRERRMLNNGGMLAHVRLGGNTLSAQKAVSASVDQGSPETNLVVEEPPVR